MKILFKILVLTNFCLSLLAQTTITVTYTSLPLTTVIRNPERGFYLHTEVHSKSSYQPLDLVTLNTYKTQNHTLILREIFLESFLKTSISSKFVDSIRSDFAKLRSTGLKCVLRFAYSDSENSVGSFDATKVQVLAHISQLKPLLVENTDVIAVMQAGFIGAWGEWYYTDYFGYPEPTDTDYANRKAVVDALLSALPATRMVQIRTPSLKQKLYSTKTALTETEAYTGSAKSRIGHHNDCFLASSDDFGTYEDIESEYPYLAQETKYLAMGGETCADNKPRSACPTALAEMQKFHWSYLNIGYNPNVINGFKTGGCFNIIQNKLGYRFELLNGVYPLIARLNSPFKIQLKLNNTGFAAPFNPRKAYLILKNSIASYTLSLGTKPNFWLPGLQTISETLTLTSAKIGSYKLYLNLPDNSVSLNTRADYSIRLANDGLWDANTGFNDLLHTISITN